MNTPSNKFLGFNKILESIEQYYSSKIQIYGPTAQGVDWNSTKSQILRFEQLLKICDQTRSFSINDYGCGYGALVDYMIRRKYTFDYRGFDICMQMIEKAKEIYRDTQCCQFFTDEISLTTADYTIASGILNVKLQMTDDEWEEYVLHLLGKIASLSKIGFSFNVLTKYSDHDRMQSNLYYADPLFLFDYCKKNFSRFVALLHDYPLYEFTILVRMEGEN